MVISTLRKWRAFYMIGQRKGTEEKEKEHGTHTQFFEKHGADR